MTNGMITVRSQSTRLPEKCFLPFGDCSVLEHVIRRAKHFNISPIVCTTTQSEDDRVIEIAKQEDVRYFRGSVQDKLLRWRDACREHDVKDFITVDADDPFFDGKLSHKSIKTLREEFDFIKHPVQQPYSGYYEGCVGYSLRLSIIEDACRLKKTDDTEMMWHFIEAVPNVRISHLDVKSDKVEFPTRLTLDYQEDYWLLCSILRIIGPFSERDEISDLLKANPDFYKINWFRNDEYKLNHDNPTSLTGSN